VTGVDRQHRAEDLVLLLADRPRFEGRRRLHRDERQDLQQVRDHHVLVGPGRLVEHRPAVQAEHLRDVDLDVIDEVPVPDRLEQAVGEPERQDVLRRLLAQEVVDPEDLPLPEGLVQMVVQAGRTRQVGAEGLLHHHPRVLHQAGVPEHGDHLQRGPGRHAQVVQALGAWPQLQLRPGHGCGERVRPGALRHVAELAGELLPLLVRDRAAAELADGVVRETAERVVVQIQHRGPDDPDLGGHRRGGQMRQAGQQLAPCQVTGRPEQHHHLRCGRFGAVTGRPGPGRRVRDRLS
jgi:hypothetical protein